MIEEALHSRWGKDSEKRRGEEDQFQGKRGEGDLHGGQKVRPGFQSKPKLGQRLCSMQGEKKARGRTGFQIGRRIKPFSPFKTGVSQGSTWGKKRVGNLIDFRKLMGWGVW